MILSIFSVIGTTYGGDTIGVISDPNLRPKYNLTVAGIAAP